MKQILFVLFMCCCSISLSGMDAISFKHLGTKEGLSDSQINHITKDSQGFMWFSTSYGLNRYDGYSCKVFTRNAKDPHSLPENFVGNIQEDGDNFLWIYTPRFGYVCYNPQKETFHPSAPLLRDTYGIQEEPSLLYIDRGKNIWSHNHFTATSFYNRKEKKLLSIPVREDFKEQNITLSCITEDKSGMIFLYTNGYIERLDRHTGQLLSCNEFLTHTSKEPSGKYTLFVDTDSDYWIYANLGIWLYYVQEDRWEYLSTHESSPYILSSDYINDIKEDAKGQLWIATDHGGINIINKNFRTIKYIENNLLDERSIIQNSLNCLYCDNDGIMWVGSYKRGVSYYSESIFKFTTDRLSEFNHIRNFTADVNAIVEDNQANLWIGTNSSGLIHINRETGKQKIYQYSPDHNSLSGNVIVSLLKGRNGKIWIGTYLNGLNVFDGEKFIRYRHDPKNPNSLANDNVWALAEDDESGYIWIGTLGSGLQGFDPYTGVFTRYAKTGGGFDNEFVTSLCMGRDKNIYMGTSHGITSFSPATGAFEKWTGNKKDTQEFSHQNINDIYEDSRGLLWIATQEGLNIYDRKKDEITIPVNEAIFGKEIIHAIGEDNNKNMWITTTCGISNIVVNVEPVTGTYTYTCYRYNELDGLQGQQFNRRSITKTFRGEIIAGGVQGLSLFDPENIRFNHSIPKVEFTNLLLFNEEVKVDSTYNGRRILSKPLNHTPEIKLKHSQNVFSIVFSAMTYILPEKNRYMYRLEGFNSNWLEADANKLVYTNLAPGRYTLKVKAVNSDGLSSDNASELKIIITPPFWASPAAYVFYLLMIAAALFLARRQLLRNERHKFKLIRMEQEAQQKHEIDDMKLRFFTNISHELRTPLTLIISPLENVIRSIEDQGQKAKLEMVHRNAMRLLHMVNQLLDFRKSDVKGHQLHLVKGDIVDFIRTAGNSFSEYSEKKNVHLTFFSSVKELTMDFDEDKIGKVIMNLLSNAFKFTPEGGRVDISLSLSAAQEGRQELLEIKISDTGTGISDEDKERIFERFFQAQHKEGRKWSGSGIGLHLVKEFVSLHHGTVSVLDNAGKGSVFIVTLPVTREQAGPLQEVEPKAVPPGENDNEGGELPVVLIVDDNEDFRLFMRDSLQAEYQVKEAPDGAKAWDMIPTLQPDIIISDVMMPEMDGNELCKSVKTDIRTSHIPLILLTARSAKEQKLEGLESGADDYVTKPFDFDILALRIKKLLQLQQKRQESFKRQIEVAPSEITITSLDEKLIKKAIRYVEDNLSRSELSVEELSRELGMSRVHLYKKLLLKLGIENARGRKRG